VALGYQLFRERNIEMSSLKLVIRRPDDMHAHFRDDLMMKAVLPWTAQSFARAVAMPNLVPAVKTVADALAYRERLLAVVSREGLKFEPLMTLYLTEETSVKEICEAAENLHIIGFKYYPRGATTNSAEGVQKFDNVKKQLKAMERHGIALLIHGEDNFDSYGQPADPFDKELLFVKNTLPRLRDEYPKLRIVLEHITTERSANYVEENGDEFLAATITPHHLTEDRRALFDGGLNPHYFCLPVLKRSNDRDALRRLATAGHPFVFAGTDTAPHPTHAKERACGCAGGCFVAPMALGMYAEVFWEENAILKLEKFLSEHGAKWYGLRLNEGTITLVRNDEPDASYPFTMTEDNVKVRPYGMHDDPAKSLKWHWHVER
jgi:dihydroorotase